jgi:hypothetical protein
MSNFGRHRGGRRHRRRHRHRRGYSYPVYYNPWYSYPYGYDPLLERYRRSPYLDPPFEILKKKMEPGPGDWLNKINWPTVGAALILSMLLAKR